MSLPGELQELRKMAALYQKRGMFEAAEEINNVIVNWLLQNQRDDLSLAVAYCDLARSLEGQERIQEAQSFYHRGIAIWQKLEGGEVGDDETCNLIAALQSIQNEAQNQFDQSETDSDVA